MENELQRLKREVRKLRELAYKDELTGLYNRRGFKEEALKFINEAAIAKEIAEKRKSVVIRNFSLIIFDIDHFKRFNDHYGHPAGDEALKFVSQLILERVRDIDVAARWGGEELIVGLVGAGEQDAFNVAEDIREKLNEGNFIYRRKKLEVTVSGGVAALDRAKNFENLINYADRALYQAKKLGRNRIIKYSEL